MRIQIKLDLVLGLKDSQESLGPELKSGVSIGLWHVRQAGIRKPRSFGRLAVPVAQRDNCPRRQVFVFRKVADEIFRQVISPGAEPSSYRPIGRNDHLVKVVTILRQLIEFFRHLYHTATEKTVDDGRKC